MVRGGPAKRAVKRAKIFALTKGFRGRAKNCYSIAVRAAHKALQHAYRGRRLKKRDMRRVVEWSFRNESHLLSLQLWIQRVNFAAQEHGISYSRFMHSLVQLNILLNRKVLSELAIHEPRTFRALAEVAKKRRQAGLMSALEDSQIEQYQSRATANEKAETETELYRTRTVVTESGSKVAETAV